MKIKLLSIGLLLSVAVGLSAYDFEVDGLYYNITNDTLAPYTAEVTHKESSWGSGSGTYPGLEIANIPESVIYEHKTYNVTSIGYHAFSWCEGLKSVTIPNSVTSIAGSAFEYCKGLTSITIPNSVTSIGVCTFEYCTGLTSITIPNSVTSIGGAAFRGCTGLTSITIPNSVTDIGGFAFDGTPWYNNQPDGVVFINNVLYRYKGEMPDNTSITVENGTISIASCAFAGCKGLTSIIIPNSVTSIGTAVFQGCTNLTSIVVESDNPNYDSRNNCNAIIETKSNALVASCRTTIIPNSVTSIGDYAFYGCTGLTSITIPNGVTSIGYYAFYGCTGLTSITIPNGVTSIGYSAFDGCTGLTSITIPNGVTSIEDDTFWGCTGLTSITIPNGVTSIGYYAFKGCTSLTSITIPNSVTSIGYSAFDGCTSLTSITIPNSVTSIGGAAFRGCTGLTSITIPNSVTSIGNSAFYGCTGIDTLIIGNGITEIGYQFMGCSGIKYLQLGSGVKFIGGAFYGAQKLKRIVCYAVEPPVADKNCFYNYNIHVQVPCDNLEDYETDVVWGSFKYIECIGAENADTDGKVIITPSDNEVEITWPSDGSADTYNLVITQDSKEVCTLVFNSNGQLMRIAVAAPSRNGEPHHAPAAVLTQSGYRFTVTGLNSGTQYAYTLDVKDKAGTSLNTYKGSFTTTVNGIATDMEDITTDTSLESDTPRKVFRDGQVYILRGGKTYTIMGGYLSNLSKGEAQ